MKKFSAVIIATLITINAFCTTSFAEDTYMKSLDEVISDTTVSETTVQETTPAVETTASDQSEGSEAGNVSQNEDGTETGNNTSNNGTDVGSFFGTGGTYDQVQSLKDATNLNESSEGAAKINQGIKSIASFIVQVLAYAVTALLVLRVLLDLAYICLPFTRSFLANGYGGNAQAGGGGAPMGMNGMGMPGMGMSGMGMGMGGMGMGRMGMHGMNGMGMGMNGMGMNGMGMQQSQPGATPAMGRIQWVSNSALNAVAAETVVGPDGKAISPMKMYAKDMIIILVIAPVFLVLAITGSLTSLGLLIGDMIANGIASAGTMV